MTINVHMNPLRSFGVLASVLLGASSGSAASQAAPATVVVQERSAVVAEAPTRGNTQDIAKVSATRSAGDAAVIEPLDRGLSLRQLQEAKLAKLAALKSQEEAAARRAEAKMWRIDLADQTIRQTMQRWAESEQWQLVWEADRDFGIDANVELSGSFKDAVTAVMHALADTDYPLQAQINSNTKVIRIQRYLDIRAR